MKLINIYLCGPTVYNSPHIGNMRPIMFFDIFIRAKRALGTQVNFVHNITDIDDKIITKAQEEKVDENTIALRYTKEYLHLLDQFNIIMPTHVEKVTNNLNKINEYIEKIKQKGFAYQSQNNIFLEVNKISNYGSISGQNTANLHNDPKQLFAKKSPHDFALWKSTNLGIKYDSSFGKGRPGWHTECAAIIDKHFGAEGVDIHGGGIDLKFPHHENENAQHFATYQKPLAKQWLWTGLINLNDIKMSKSLGNLLLAKDFLKTYDKDLFRMIILTSGLSSTINLNSDLLESNLKILNRFKAIYNLYFLTNKEWEKTSNKVTIEIIEELGLLNFANANKKIHFLLNNNKNNFYDKELITIFQVIGFSFSHRYISDYQREIYQNWQKAREIKDFVAADKMRAILKNDDLI